MGRCKPGRGAQLAGLGRRRAAAAALLLESLRGASSTRRGARRLFDPHRAIPTAALLQAAATPPAALASYMGLKSSCPAMAAHATMSTGVYLCLSPYSICMAP